MYAGYAGVTLCFSTHNDVCLPYLLDLTTDEQKARWLPGVSSGEIVLAIAMTEPQAGSDFAAIATTAVRDGDHFVVNGAKTFITNGINADLVITAVKTDPAAGRKGMSVLALERGMAGFERGRNLDKIGLHSQDTAELSFTDVHVPVTNVIGTIGDGFLHMMRNLPQERLGLAMAALAGARAAVDLTVAYTKERTAFGQPIAAFQNTKFRLAEMATEVEIGQVFIDRCIVALNDGVLTPEEAAMAKWWCTELQKRTVDTCLQLHGGYGYMREYPIARAYTDARITTIFGGTTEIMKEIIGRDVVS
jgi:alkylation response protein AidB-like acyl-CoA dehydrogenase